MAGVRFDLKKIFDKAGCFAGARVYFMSSFITICPMILCILLFLIMQKILKFLGETYDNILLFNSIVIYSFFISYIVSNGINMLVSRYVSNCIYSKDVDNIFESLIGTIILFSIVSLLAMSIILFKSDLSVSFKILSILITNLLGIMWIEITYLSAIKDYIKIVIAFILGFITIVAISIVGFKVLGMSQIFSALVATLIGYVLIASYFMIKLYKVFGTKDLKLRSCIRFLSDFDKYPELLFVGFFIALGAYGHNLVVWFSDKATIIHDTFRIAQFYDVPSFFAYLTIIPTVVIFTVKVETMIYPKYKEFYNFVRDIGSIKEIDRAKDELIRAVSLHIKNMIEVQFIFTFACIVMGIKVLPMLGFDTRGVEIFSILTLASLSYITVSFLIIILLYFDGRKEALIVATVFMISTIVLSFINLMLGDTFYGYGFFVGGLISVVVSFGVINKFFKKIEYHIFASQPVFKLEGKGIFTRLLGMFNE